MPALQPKRKQSHTLQTQKQTPTAASASRIGVKGTATTLPKLSGAKPGSALEERLLFQIRALQLPEPVREYKFHPTRRWRSDFAWPDCRLLVEVEGAHWTNGRHTRGSGFEADCEKYSEAALNGWAVIRCTSTHIKSGEAVDWIQRALSVRVVTV